MVEKVCTASYSLRSLNTTDTDAGIRGAIPMQSLILPELMIPSGAAIVITRGCTVLSDLIVLAVTVYHVVPHSWSLLKVT